MGPMTNNARTARHTHTDVEGNRYESYPTSALRPGDVVLNSGMLILLVDRREIDWSDMRRPSTYALSGYVLNPADVTDFVGNLLYTWDDHYSCHAARWTVQGNDRAIWRVLASGPRYDALRIDAALTSVGRLNLAPPAKIIFSLTHTSLELSLAAVTLSTGADPSRLPQGILRRREDQPAYTANDFFKGIEEYRKAHLST